MSDPSVVAEEFVKITHSKEEKGTRDLGFEIEVLAHGGGHLRVNCLTCDHPKSRKTAVISDF
jgi:hypothetical protein